MEVVFDFLKGYFTLLVSLAALAFSIYNYKKTRRITLYSDIDGKYLELLKLGISNPKFTDYKLTRNYKQSFEGDELLKYERYAFAAWNIVETICDRQADDELFRTWRPVIREENRLHREWLNQPENQHKFKNDFWKFLIRSGEFPCPECEKVEGDRLCGRCADLETLAAKDEDMPVAPPEPSPPASRLTGRSEGDDAG